MKKLDFVLTAAAAMMFAGCANDDTVMNAGGEAEQLSNATIGFNLTVPGQTRATLSGKDAATKLNNEFVVFGIKNAVTGEGGIGAQNTFTNYKVTFDNNSAGSTESNTNNWEYVGQTPYAEAKVTPAVTSQTVKYWDYSATNGYTFTAFAGKDFLGNDKAKVEKITTVGENKTEYDKGYTVTVPSAADLSKIFFSDRKVVNKTDYNKPVALTFRNFGAKIRVGFYETIPGYSVKIDKFYCDTDAQAPVTTFKAMDTAPTDGKFVAALQNVNPSATDGNQVTVTYYGANTANENQPKVNCGSSSSYQYTLTLGSGITSANSLKTTASNPTWDTSGDDNYSMVYPNLEASTPMLIRCDYTLTADDNSGETIKVKNARVTVPVQYCQWKSNYAYTYLFKISNNTNGTTGDNPSDPDNPTDPEGLYPITFDAVVMESTDYAQETTTTVATNSVTSYAKDGYANGKDIYFVNTTKQTAESATSYKVLVPTAIGDEATKADVYKVAWSNTDKSDAIVEGDVFAQLTGVKNGLTMTAITSSSDPTGTVALSQTVPSADGTNLDFGQNGAVKFTPSAAGTYAYVYCTTKYVAPTYSESSQYEAGKTYYANTDTTPANGVYYVASGITDEASYNKYKTDSKKLYTQTAQGTAGVYDIKVITVKK